MLTRLKRFLKKIRELIWPLLEPSESIESKEITIEDCRWEDSEIELMLKYIEQYAASEENRKNQIESKASIFIGTFTIVITVLLSLIKDILFKDVGCHNYYNVIIVFLMSITVIYLCRAIWFAIKAMGKQKYCKFGFPKFMLDQDNKKKKKIIIDQYNIIEKNQEGINLKVDYMTMAQEYFKRAIVVVGILTLFIFINEVIVMKNLIYIKK